MLINLMKGFRNFGMENEFFVDISVVGIVGVIVFIT
jgi:hypothetical protein